jgi:hypothetical protein
MNQPQPRKDPTENLVILLLATLFQSLAVLGVGALPLLGQRPLPAFLVQIGANYWLVAISPALSASWSG